ncbi:MAG: hypothetical protein ABI212_11810 [Burkholderiaceae bacterium]
MTENVENLLLEHLKRFQAGHDRIERDLKEIKARLSTLESGQRSLLRHIGHSASSIASRPPGDIKSFIGMFAGRSHKLLSIEDMNETVAAGWAGEP